MIYTQNGAVRTAVLPDLVSFASSISGEVVDCIGFDYVMVVCSTYIAGGTVTSIKLNFGDTTSPTDTYRQFGDVSSSISETVDGGYGTAPTDGESRVFLIDLRTRPRYMQVEIACSGFTGTVSGVAFFSRLGESNYTNVGIAGSNGEAIQG